MKSSFRSSLNRMKAKMKIGLADIKEAYSAYKIKQSTVHITCTDPEVTQWTGKPKIGGRTPAQKVKEVERRKRAKAARKLTRSKGYKGMKQQGRGH